MGRDRMYELAVSSGAGGVGVGVVCWGRETEKRGGGHGGVECKEEQVQAGLRCQCRIGGEMDGCGGRR